MPLSQYDERVAMVQSLRLEPGDGTSDDTLWSSSPDHPSRVDVIYAGTDASTDQTVLVKYTSNMDNFTPSSAVGKVVIPAGAGQGTVAMVNVLDALLGVGQAGFAFPPNTGLIASATVAVPTDKTIWFTAFGGEL